MVDGRRFVNDSQATTPEATIAALQSTERPIWLLAGGADKGMCFSKLAAEIVRRTRGAAFFGQQGGPLANAVSELDSHFVHTQTQSLDGAFTWCWERATAGEVILLSPACSSRDQYRDYAQRAADFQRQIAKVAPNAGHHPLAVDLV